MRFRYTAACAVAAMVGLFGLRAGTARADSVTPLPALSYVHQVLVDDSAGYVFISEGFFSSSLQTSGGGLLVTSLAGKTVTTLDAGHGVEGIAISGGTLYAALDADHAVAAISISTIMRPTPTQTLIPLSNSGELPYDLALQSGKLWVSYTGGIGDINIAAAHPAFTPDVLTGVNWYYAPDLAADPDNHGFIAAADPGLVPTPMATYDVAGSSPTLLAQTVPLHITDCESGELGIAMPAGGATFMVICDGYPGALVFNTANLTPAGSVGGFPGSPLAGAVTVAPNGTVAVSAAGGASPGASYIGTFTAGGTALNTYQSSFQPYVMTNGLAWSSNSTRLYAVLRMDSSNPLVQPTYSLRVIDNAVGPALTLTGASRATYGTPVSLSGTVLAGSVPPPAGASVTVTRTVKGSASITRFTTVTTDGGIFTFTDRTHPVPGRYSYTASFNGGNSPAATVTISPEPATVRMALHGFYATSRHGTTVYLLYHHTARVTATITEKPARPGECVRLEVQKFYKGKWRTPLSTSCAALRRTGTATAFLAASKEAVGYTYRIRAVFVPGRDTTITGAESGWQYFIVEK